MQTSSTFPQLSDGTRKTIVGSKMKSKPRVDRLTPGDHRDKPKPKGKK